MQLLVQPGDGIEPLVTGINEAQSSVEILIFRFDRVEIEAALVNAVRRGVAVRALIAYTNRGGDRSLRALELRLLAAGITVARTADDLVRYHGKMMIVDGRELYLMSFNLTHLDMESSRSFAVITDDRKSVEEAVKLFDADSKRLQYTPGLDTFVVSPVNARRVLSDFIKGTQRQLLIYDPAVADPPIIHLLDERAKSGVEIKLIGRLSRKLAEVEVHTLSMRVHTRMLIRDGQYVFLGSQSLRTAEMDARREVGLIFQDPRIAARLKEVFCSDWNEPQNSKAISDNAAAPNNPHPDKVAKKVAKTVVKSLPPVTPLLKEVVRELNGTQPEVAVNPEELEATVRDAVRSAIKDVVAVAVEKSAKGAE